MTDESSPDRAGDGTLENEAGRSDDSPHDSTIGDAFTDGAESGESDPSLGGIVGAESRDSDGSKRRPITPGDPSLENAAFVVFGVLFSLFVLYRVWVVFVP